MTQEFEAFAAKATSDHEIQVFYRIDGLSAAASLALKLKRIEKFPGLPDDQKPALVGRYGHAHIWKKSDSSDAGQDFHSHVRELIEGRRKGLTQRLIIDDTARQLLSTASLYERERSHEERKKKKLVLSLSDAAKRRLAQYSIVSDDIIVHIDDLSLFIADTGHSFAITTLQFSRPDRKPVSAAELLEAQILLVRFGKVRWMHEDGSAGPSESPFVLGDLIQYLACARVTQDTLERVTTSTYVRLAAPLEKRLRDRYALHLARHYTSDYEVSSDITGVEFVTDFDTVRHAVALEGAATVVGASPERPVLPTFLNNFKTGTYRRHYVPIALLARHEHAFLVRRTFMAVASAANMTPSEATINRLAALRHDFVHFRLSYRFSELSFVTMHNTLNQAFRKILHLDRMLADLGADVAAADVLLRESYERRKYSHFYLITGVGGAALAALTAFTIIKEATNTLWHGNEVHNGKLALCCAVIAGLLSLGLAYLKRPAAFEKGHDWEKLKEQMKHHMVSDQAKSDSER